MTNDLISEHKPNGFALLLTPTTIAEIDKFCEMLANSGMVPQAYAGKPKAIAIAGAMGSRLGVDIFSALAGIAVINGRPSIWGDLMLAVCQASPDFVDIEERVEVSKEDTVAFCTVHRKGRKPYVTQFSFNDAKTAGLWGKAGPWTTNPKRMCGMRARAFGLRAVFADRLAGMVSREEMEDADLIEVQGTSLPDPKVAKSRRLAATDPAASDKGTAIEAKAQPGDKLIEAIAKHENAKQADAETIVITDAEEQSKAQSGAVAPQKLTPGDLVKMVRSLHDEFKDAALPGIKRLNDRFGVKKTGEIPQEHIEAAATAIMDLTRELAEGDTK